MEMKNSRTTDPSGKILIELVIFKVFKDNLRSDGTIILSTINKIKTNNF